MITLEALRIFSEAAISIFAIVNPIGGLPVFVALTEDMPKAERRRLFRLAGVAALVIISLMALAGQVLMHDVFHVTMEQFAFGGGLLLVVIGMRGILQEPKPASAAAADADTQRRLAVRLAISPIASPLLVGPGSIVNVMLLANQHGRLFAVAACLTAFVFVILILNYAHVVYRLMGQVVALAFGRVMQIFIIAIGVKFCFQAAVTVFPGLVR